jgi:hypothetical protein
LPTAFFGTVAAEGPDLCGALPRTFTVVP